MSAEAGAGLREDGDADGDEGGGRGGGGLRKGLRRNPRTDPHRRGPDDGYRPSARRLAHEAYRRSRSRRSALIAGASTLATAVALYLLVVNSPAGRPPGRRSSTPTTPAGRCRR